MEKYTIGTVCFDNLTVLGKEFLTTPYPNQTAYYNYAFGVSSFDHGIKVKKGEPPKYTYWWNGHINIGMEGTRIHLHNIDGDIQLLKQEAKLQLLKDTIEQFLKENKERTKTPAKEDMFVKHWLNPGDSRYTGYVAFHIEKDGGGNISFADCHKSIIHWQSSGRDANGKVLKYDDLKRGLKYLEELAKGLDKAIKAIHNLRKFFEREVFEGVEK